MLNAIIFLIILFLTFWVFFIPRSFKYAYTLFLLTGGIILSSLWCFEVFSGNNDQLVIRLDLQAMQSSFILTIDRLSAFFILVVNLNVLIGFLYARGYLKPYYHSKNALRFSLHYFSYLWLYFSMILVVMLRDGLSFLIMWEIMALSSFLLVIFDAEERSIMKTGINYLIQMHVGLFFILAAFLVVSKGTGRMSFDALGPYFSDHSNLPLFILFFTGFGIKAGFIPLHTWLPQAHPAAPSHVSGVMSGVMIKMGIYGILRVLMSVQSDLFLIGIIILAISLISGLLGVMMAIMQHDLKKLLAYHSIENIGIIGIGIGLGVIGLATNNAALSLLGFSGGLLHVLNHSLFKSLLFFNAGSVYQSTHTRNIEQLGGLMKKMPYTAVFFLIGSLAICGLPPFNGFISEYLIYLGMFKSLSTANLFQSIIVMISLAGLALIGGMAVFCFTKAFGIVFLGEPRSKEAAIAVEVQKSMIYPQYVTIAFILLIGLASAFFVKPVFSLVSQEFNITGIEVIASLSVHNLTQISIIGGIFILAIMALLVYRHFHLKTKQIETGPTWGCGYTAATSKHQYTATSYADNFISLANPVLGTKKNLSEIRKDEIFPVTRKYETHSHDFFKKYIIDKPVSLLLELLKKIAIMQTGQIQHYILYLFIYMLILFLLSYFNLI
jgi:formate hydrogenlyase subunit 3/multisubunit Na+/H+ antiporter MnhD subunit